MFALPACQKSPALLQNLAVKLALVLLPVGSTAACTTSRAVIAWHDGWQAEAAGDLALAEKRYGEAAAADKGQAGAACNRVRLMARHPDRQQETKEALEPLLKTKSAWPEVAAIGALAALKDGDAKLAQQRLAAARALNDGDRQDVRGGLRMAKVAVAAVQGHWREASDTKLLAGLPQEATAVRLAAATATYNGGDVALAGKLLPEQAGAEAAELRAWLAADRGDWAAVRTALEQVPEADRTPRLDALKAWSLVRSGDGAGGLALAADAARRDPDDPVAAQVWATASLSSGQASQARDLLAGLAARGGGWAVWFNLGLAQLVLADPQAALQAFEQSALRCPTCAPATKNRDVLRRVLGVL